LRVLQASANVTELLRRPAERLIGAPVEGVLGQAVRSALEGVNGTSLEGQPLYVGTIPIGPDGLSQPYEAVAHRVDGVLVLELEPTDSPAPAEFHELYPLVRTFLGRLANVATTEELTRIAAREVRRLTGFDHVLVSRFQDGGNLEVIAEDRSETCPSLQGRWFPASDIPAEARDLYRMNHWRFIADARQGGVPLVPDTCSRTGRPLDLTYAALRGITPAQSRHLSEMGVAAAMAVAIVREGSLWGLISCHHGKPRKVPFAARTACDFLADVLSAQIAARERNSDYQERIELKTVQHRILAAMAGADPYINGLTRNPDELLRFARAEGAAVLFEGECNRVGRTPDEPAIQRLVDWLVEHGREDVFCTDSLPAMLEDGERYREVASGVLALSLSGLHRTYVLWFRPEAHTGSGARARSVPWRASEVDAARDLRRSIVAVVLRKAEELAELTAELERSNAELEAFSYSVSHDLRAPFRHILGYAELLRERLAGSEDDKVTRYIDTIVESAQFAGVLVDNLLSFSQIARASLHLVPVDMNLLVREVSREVSLEAEGREIDWRLQRLPTVMADLPLLRQVMSNLLSNAVKYTRSRERAVIEVAAEPRENELVFVVRDNGVGFDMRYADKLFGVFQRLHRMEEFEGTGIGLANVRRIVSRHGGQTWAEGEVGRGASFYFTLPEETVEAQ